MATAFAEQLCAIGCGRTTGCNLYIAAVEQMDLSMVEQAGATVYCSMGQQREYHQPRYDFKPPIRNLSFASTTQTPIFSL